AHPIAPEIQPVIVDWIVSSAPGGAGTTPVAIQFTNPAPSPASTGTTSRAADEIKVVSASRIVASAPGSAGMTSSATHLTNASPSRASTGTTSPVVETIHAIRS